MKKFPLSCFALFAILTFARGDLTIVQSLEGTTGINKLTMKVKGDRARVEMSPEMTMIVDGKSGDLITLLNDRKMVMRISGDKAKAMAAMAKSLIQDDSSGTIAPKPTGKKETINGYQAEEYAADNAKFHATWWVAKAYPDYQAILQQMKVLQNGAFAAVRKGMPDFYDFPGLPIRTKVKLQGQGEITTTIDSVSQATLPEAEFAAPTGYTEMKMPNVLGGQQSPATPAKPEGQ
jgi:hypothetical protein